MVAQPVRCGPALGDGALEQALRQRRAHESADADGAGRLAEDGHVARVAAEGADVLLHPVQGRYLVQNAVVAAGVLRGLGREGRVHQEAERAEPVVDADQHHARPGQRGAVVGLLGPAALVQAAAVHPDHHRAGGIPRPRGSPDVQPQAILVHRPHVSAQGAWGLRTGRAEVRRVAHAFPRRGRRRRLPAQRADRRRGVGDAQVGGHAVLEPAPDAAGRGPHHKCILRRCQRGQGGKGQDEQHRGAGTTGSRHHRIISPCRGHGPARAHHTIKNTPAGGPLRGRP